MYGLFASVGLLLGLALTAVQAHLLSRNEFGQIALVLAFSSLLTVVYNAGSLQGALGQVFSGSEDDVVDDAVDASVPAEEKARIMGTGLVLTTILGVVGVVAVVLLAKPLAPLLGLRRSQSGIVIAAGVGALFAAQARYLHNMFRYAHRPIAFGVLNNVRTFAALIAVWLLLGAGYGIDAVVWSFAGGAAVAVLAAMVAAHGQFRLSFSIERVRTIYRFGRAMIPVALGIFALQQGSVYVIYLFGDKADLADYRLASSLATIAGYGIGSFNAASGPLKQSPLQRGIDSQQANAWLLTYFVIFALGVLVVLSAVADWLVKIAPGSYSGAAALIPAIGGSYCAWGLYQMSYRTSALAGGRRLFSWLAVANVAVFAILSALLVPSIGPFGAALAATGGFMTGALTLLITSQRSATRLPLAYGRLAAAVLAAAICAASPRLAADLDLPLELAVDAGAILAYPILLIVTRALPLAEAKTLLGAARDILPGRAERRAMAARAQTLSPHDLSLATPILRPPRPRLRRASITRTDPLADAARITAYLAGVREDVREAAPTDEILGQYLFARVSMARRAQLANELLEAGVPGLDVDLIEGALREIQRLPSSAWPGPDARRRKRFRRLRRSRPAD